MLKSSFCNYSDVYILFKGTITIVGAGANDAGRATERTDKQYLKIMHRSPIVWVKKVIHK